MFSLALNLARLLRRRCCNCMLTWGGIQASIPSYNVCIVSGAISCICSRGIEAGMRLL